MVKVKVKRSRTAYRGGNQKKKRKISGYVLVKKQATVTDIKERKRREETQELKKIL